jgi:hypothetical protein
VGNAFAADLRDPSAREEAWNVPCKIDFTSQQVDGHFSWPDAPFGADFELLGTLSSASISDHCVRIKPTAIERSNFEPEPDAAANAREPVFTRAGRHRPGMAVGDDVRRLIMDFLFQFGHRLSCIPAVPPFHSNLAHILSFHSFRDCLLVPDPMRMQECIPASRLSSNIFTTDLTAHLHFLMGQP